MTPRIKEEHSERDMKCAKWMFERVLDIWPKAKKPGFKNWAACIRLMRQRDGRTYKEIYDVFTWANKHDFWSRNILSPQKLRAQFDRLALQMGLDAEKQKQAKEQKRIKIRPAASLPSEPIKPGDDYYEALKKFGFNPRKD